MTYSVSQRAATAAAPRSRPATNATKIARADDGVGGSAKSTACTRRCLRIHEQHAIGPERAPILEQLPPRRRRGHRRRRLPRLHLRHIAPPPPPHQKVRAQRDLVRLAVDAHRPALRRLSRLDGEPGLRQQLLRRRLARRRARRLLRQPPAHRRPAPPQPRRLHEREPAARRGEDDPRFARQRHHRALTIASSRSRAPACRRRRRAPAGPSRTRRRPRARATVARRLQIPAPRR